jgi:hypothetical protein
MESVVQQRRETNHLTLTGVMIPWPNLKTAPSGDHQEGWGSARPRSAVWDPQEASEERGASEVEGLDLPSADPQQLVL